LSGDLKMTVETSMGSDSRARLSEVLSLLEIPTSTWYRKRRPESERRKPGPLPKTISPEIIEAVATMAATNPWYGYKRIAVMCRREEHDVSNRDAYRVMKERGLLQRKRPRDPELHQAKKLYELLPTRPNELWQMDVTYIHVPGHGWWYAVTVIDYYSRYLLACHLTSSYSAVEVIEGLKAARREAERLRGPLASDPVLVTDNGSSFLAKKFGQYIDGQFSHVRIQYRTPTQLGLLERFHCTLKTEEVYWRLYDNPAHCRDCLEEFRERYNAKRPHWALVPEVGGDPLTPRDVYVDGIATKIPRWQGWAREAKKKMDGLLQEAAA